MIQMLEVHCHPTILTCNITYFSFTSRMVNGVISAIKFFKCVQCSQSAYIMSISDDSGCQGAMQELSKPKNALTLNYSYARVRTLMLQFQRMCGQGIL